MVSSLLVRRGVQRLHTRQVCQCEHYPRMENFQLCEDNHCWTVGHFEKTNKQTDERVTPGLWAINDCNNLQTDHVLTFIFIFCQQIASKLGFWWNESTILGRSLCSEVFYDRILNDKSDKKKEKNCWAPQTNSMIQVWLRAHTVLACVCLRAVISGLHKSDEWGSSWLLMGSEGAQHT